MLSSDSSITFDPPLRLGLLTCPANPPPPPCWEPEEVPLPACDSPEVFSTDIVKLPLLSALTGALELF